MKTIFRAAVVMWLLAAIAAQAAESRLFRDDEPIRLRMEIDLSGLCWKQERVDCGEVPATLVQIGHHDRTRTFHVRVSARGNFRMTQQQCSAPLMFIRFFRSDTRGSVFEGQSLVPLTTQCSGERARFRDYLLNEYIAHRIYEQLTPLSLKSRLVNIKIIDAGRRLPGTTLYAFFTEHFDDLARRNRTARVDFEAFDPGLATPESLTVMALFQYMIGNTDWSVIDGHNITYVEARNGTPYVVPYDFDFSGLVNADYAGPPPNLPIRSVRQRIYRGFCFDDFEWSSAYQVFLDNKDAILGLPGLIRGMSFESRRETQRYLAGFFQVIESPRQREAKIENACRKWVM